MAEAKRKRQARNSWGAVRKLPSGRWQASYLGTDGERHLAKVTFDTKDAATGWLAKVRTQISAGEWRSPAQMAEEEAKATREAEARAIPFSEFAEKWLSTRYNANGEPLRPTTMAEYRRLLAGPLAPLAGMVLPEITHAVVLDWRAAALKGGKRTQTSHAYTLLRSILQSAVDRKIVSENPCTIRGAASMRTEKVVKPPTAKELAVIVAAMPQRHRVMTQVAAWSGLRFGELTELRRKDVAITRKDGVIVKVVLHVRRAVTHVAGQGAIVGPPKSKTGKRDVVLPPRPGLYEALSSHLANEVLASPDALLFPAVDGVSHLRQSTLTRAFYPARAKAGRGDLPWHGLRHFDASAYAAAGANEAEVMARLGQKSPGISRRYTHTTGREDLLAERMGAA